MNRRNPFARSLLATLAACVLAGPVAAQEDIPGRVEVAWNKYYTYAELEAMYREIARAYPDLVKLVPIGESIGGRTMWVAIVTAPNSGPHDAKPAMWIDGNVHGNEIQAAEVVAYTLWYLTKAHGQNERLTEMLENYSFYLLVSANPDGREFWFSDPNTPHSSRHNHRPYDNDRDGLIDEDPYDDLDGDGHITTMWRKDPNGQFVRDEHDPRIFRRVEQGRQGEWSYAGQEGIDNDGDGRINEDGPFADDMNRNYPGDWQPNFIQFGAGEYPFSSPETAAIGRFILDHPNIAAVQSYHNTGGMILRGPGAAYRESLYSRGDRQVYDRIADVGEDLLPYYRSMVIHSDLYGVHGGFVNWTAETLGIVSFTNEMWATGKYFQHDKPVTDEREWLWRDRMAFGQLFTDYTEYEHPTLGPVLIGGPNKWSSRNTPTFMLEEECHRNFAFTMFHADHMPLLSMGQTRITELGDGLWQVDLAIRNEKVIPTRLDLASSRRIGQPDLLTLEPVGNGSVVASGSIGHWLDPQMRGSNREPGRVLVNGGIAGESNTLFRFIIQGREGDRFTLRYEAEKARDLEAEIVLEPTEDGA